MQCARAKSPGTRGTDALCPLICSRASISPADIKSALDSLGWVMGECLSEGYHVKLEGVGYFSLSLRTLRADEGHMRVGVNGVNFHCDPTLLERLRKAPLKRDYAAEKEFHKVEEKDWTEDMLLLLRQTGYMSPRLFSTLTGCSRRQATARLKKYVEEGLLICRGRGKHTLYLPVSVLEPAGE